MLSLIFCSSCVCHSMSVQLQICKLFRVISLWLIGKTIFSDTGDTNLKIIYTRQSQNHYCSQIYSFPSLNLQDILRAHKLFILHVQLCTEASYCASIETFCASYIITHKLLLRTEASYCARIGTFCASYIIAHKLLLRTEASHCARRKFLRIQANFCTHPCGKIYKIVDHYLNSYINGIIRSSMDNFTTTIFKEIKI